MIAISEADMGRRIVRYGDLRPCFNAFVDTRTPGSQAKENFTIIGPGVSENPAQHVHIAEPHGFNIGGARQPPRCVNSQHSHQTAEVFVAHSGRWRFDLGETGQDAQVEIGPGDLISLPTGVFRGFTNIGDDVAFLWAVLGEDDPGRVTWAPQVFELAKDYGLLLMENGLLVDTAAGEVAPPGLKPLAPTTAREAAAMKRLGQADAETLVARADSARAGGEQPLIGPGGALRWPHGFTVSRRALRAGADPVAGQFDDAEVMFVHEGALRIDWAGGSVRLAAGDTISLPAGLSRSLSSPDAALIFSVRRCRQSSDRGKMRPSG